MDIKETYNCENGVELELDVVYEILTQNGQEGCVWISGRLLSIAPEAKIIKLDMSERYFAKIKTFALREILDIRKADA